MCAISAFTADGPTSDRRSAASQLSLGVSDSSLICAVFVWSIASPWAKSQHGRPGDAGVHVLWLRLPCSALGTQAEHQHSCASSTADKLFLGLRYQVLYDPSWVNSRVSCDNMRTDTVAALQTNAGQVSLLSLRPRYNKNAPGKQANARCRKRRRLQAGTQSAPGPTQTRSQIFCQISEKVKTTISM